MKRIFFLILLVNIYTIAFAQILEENFWKNQWDPSSDLNASIISFLSGKESYEKGDLVSARLSFENSLRNYSLGVCYYMYGLTLMDQGRYSMAERAYFKAIEGFLDRDVVLINEGLLEEKAFKYNYSSDQFAALCSYDENQNCRELYFTFYNLACLYSIQGDLQKAEKHVIEALEYGYPYLDYIFSDSDLNNLFTSPNFPGIKERIITAYNRGNDPEIVKGKAFEKWVASSGCVYLFMDEKNVQYRILGSERKDHYYAGTFVVRNYTILIQYNLESQRAGSDPLPGVGSIAAFQRYSEPIELKISISDGILWKLMMIEREYNGWEQTSIEEFLSK